MTLTIILAIVAVLAAIIAIYLARENSLIRQRNVDQINEQNSLFQREQQAREKYQQQVESERKIQDDLRTRIDREQQAQNQLRDEIMNLRAEEASLRAKLEAADAQIKSKDDQLKSKDDQINRQKELTSEMLKQQEDRFKNLASEILESNAQRFNEASTRKINDMLSPLKENIENFRKVVGDVYNNESRERISLRHELRDLLELNKTISKEARDLTRALRSDSKVQGDWGEMILEQLLEKSGLQKGTHFDTQVTRDVDGTKLIGDDGKSLRADVVVYYPDDRCIVIDSKVSLTAFVDYINLSEDPEDVGAVGRREAAARHLASMRGHINELARKNYQDLIGKKRMDFVIMFIPNEAAYIAAMQIEPNLWQEAYDKRVLIASPTQLISVLRMLTQLWKQDTVNRNVEEIARLAGRMLDKFSGMVDAMDEAEKHLGNAQKAYSTLRARLSEGNGNVIVTARKILDLGAKTTKPLPEK